MSYTPSSIAESDYEGWVAWIGDAPIFEHVPYLPHLLPVYGKEAGALDYRGAGKNTMDWMHVPGEKITRFELYFARDVFPNQPVFRADKEPGAVRTRFIQMKMGGLVINTSGSGTRGVERLGLVGYKVGVWIPEQNDCQMWEFTRNGWKFLGKRKSPTDDQPEGFGLSPIAMGA